MCKSFKEAIYIQKISQTLSNADLGIATLILLTEKKAELFAAMLAHRLPILAISQGIMEIGFRNYTPSRIQVFSG
jgi:hypothetical protein